MANYKVTTVGLPIRESRFTFVGQTSMTSADVGKAAALALGSEANTVKLAGDGDIPLGRIETVEVEMNGDVSVSVLLLGGFRLNCAVGEKFQAGDTIVGSATAGLVKSGGVSKDFRFFVSEPDTTEGFVGVIKL
ncbi:MAG: hypothetical protein [Caudoviricetes sp.]|nr:MAG: hypothetical protein [Caudoviricetes sp.]